MADAAISRGAVPARARWTLFVLSCTDSPLAPVLTARGRVLFLRWSAAEASIRLLSVALVVAAASLLSWLFSLLPYWLVAGVRLTELELTDRGEFADAAQWARSLWPGFVVGLPVAALTAWGVSWLLRPGAGRLPSWGQELAAARVLAERRQLDRASEASGETLRQVAGHPNEHWVLGLDYLQHALARSLRHGGFYLITAGVLYVLVYELGVREFGFLPWQETGLIAVLSLLGLVVNTVVGLLLGVCLGALFIQLVRAVRRWYAQDLLGETRGSDAAPHPASPPGTDAGGATYPDPIATGRRPQTLAAASAAVVVTVGIAVGWAWPVSPWWRGLSDAEVEAQYMEQVRALGVPSPQLWTINCPEGRYREGETFVCAPALPVGARHPAGPAMERELPWVLVRVHNPAVAMAGAGPGWLRAAEDGWIVTSPEGDDR